MGLLTVGIPMTWDEIKKYARYIQEEGVKQFLLLFHRLNSRLKYTLKWGDEIEYTLLRFDPVTHDAQLYLSASPLLKKLREINVEESGIIWQPEYAEYMIEALPAEPFGRLLHSLTNVEPNMRSRREELMRHLPEGCCALTISTFPRLGCPDFTFPPHLPTPTKGFSHSLFFPDAAITQGHPRFSTLTQNIRHRRGKKVAINVPIFRDSRTPNPFIEDFSELHDGSDPDAVSAALPDHVYMDAMGFGMGCSCLQITFQACCIDEARILYDHLTAVCPILMALSAASPAIKGYLLDTDCRWNIIAASVDDRTDEERGLKPLKENRFVIPKSRYESVSTYISPMGVRYNDVPLVIDDEFYKELLDKGVDDLLAKHVAHLFIREPVSLFADRIEPPPDTDFVDHFENIQSTNWQSMRFKPPPPNSSIGWRVEFRPTELQLTDFENAAFATFVLLLSRTILKFNLNLLIPLSKVDENMATAIKRDAAIRGRFFFRMGHLLTTDDSPMELCNACAKFTRSRTYSTRLDDGEHHTENGPGPCARTMYHDHAVDPNQTYELMTMNEIMNGSDIFPGLIPLIRHYVLATGGDPETLSLVDSYLDLIGKRAAGELMTTAGWMRTRIMGHPEYQRDSRVTARINADLMRECWAVTCGELRPPELLPAARVAGVENGYPQHGVTCRLCCQKNGAESDSSASKAESFHWL